MKTGYVLLFCLSTLLTTRVTVNGQVSQQLDSLTVYLATHRPTDSVYTMAMDKAIYELIYKKADYVRADSLSRQMVDVATRINDWPRVVGAYRNRAMIGYMKADYEQAMVYFQRTLTTAEQHKLSPKIIYGALCNIASGHDKLGHNEQVLQTALQAIAIQEQFKLKPRAPIPHRLIGGALVKMGKLQQAIPYYREAGTIFRENGDKRGIAIFENQLGDFYQELKQPQQALLHHQASLKLAQEIQFQLLQVDALDGLANDMHLLKRPAEGVKHIEQALRLLEQQQQPLGMSTSYGTLAQLYFDQRDYPKAETYYKKAIAIAEKHNYKDDLKRYTQGLADMYAQQTNYQQAYVLQLQKNKLIDSTATVRTNAEVQRLIARYETEKKEQQIKLLRQQAQLRDDELAQKRFQTNALLVGGVLVLLLGAAVTAWLLNRARLRRLQEAQQLRKRIAHDLHDEVGSTLSSISLLSGMVNDLIAQNRPETVARAINKINTDARQILEVIDEIIWTINPGNDSLQRIILRLQEYAQPLMESKGIQFSVVSDPGVENLPISMDVRQNLYLISKEAINNLVKYSEATKATMRFGHDKEQLKVIIEDNGRGFDVDQPSQRTGQSSMKQRATAMGGFLDIQSGVGRGTKLELVINS